MRIKRDLKKVKVFILILKHLLIYIKNSLIRILGHCEMSFTLLYKCHVLKIVLKGTLHPKMYLPINTEDILKKACNQTVRGTPWTTMVGQI